MASSPQTYPVYVYNTTNAQFTLSVNQGAAITVPPTVQPTYAPATPSGNEPVFVLSEFGGQGTFFLTNNQVVVDLPRAGGPQTIQINLDNTNVPAMVVSMQLYFYFKSASVIGWLFLVNGLPVDLSGTINGPSQGSPF